MKLLIIAALILAASTASARDQIRAVGSSTVFPFTTTVAEQFHRTTGRKAPIVESTGTGGGMRLFCAGIGVQHPDITNASRPITKSEMAQCVTNGVSNIVELKIGYDGIVLTTKKGAPLINLTKEQVWLALARQVPQQGKLVNNPYKKWSDIDPKLPNINIEIMGPPPTSGTRDAFVEMMMEEGCKQFTEVKAVSDARQRQQICAQIREDGVFIEAGENDNLIVQRLVAGRPGIVGIFGFSFLEENLDKIQAIKINNVEPTFDNISNQTYGVARSLFVYVKMDHAKVIPGLNEFIDEYLSDRSMGDNGYLEKKGLIPLTREELLLVRQRPSVK